MELPGTPDLRVQLRRSARARRFSLRVSGLDGRVTLTLPRGASVRQGADFVRSREEWIRRHLEDKPERQTPGFGALIPFEGYKLEIVPGTGRAPRLDGMQLLVPGTAESVPRKVETFLKHMARDRLAEASDRYAAKLGRDYTRITLRDTRSRWGSCSSRGALNYSWRLIMAPVEVLDYVAAHEVAHLAQMNHSPAYWQVLEGLCPDYRDHKDWLRIHGNTLHAWVFRD
ncbi:zinc metalloprotease [Actibacterium mucosum KCTC 23349]|uniref:Zinc metalloprotease n=1 Tax=Actibacterium mucosum KCTC 23349 TaxID=1454373 RepID=A0A037ZF41_9RHOB|nr:zinc metalloprotease [Actibacterium mucosum KCTC 23349]